MWTIWLRVKSCCSLRRTTSKLQDLRRALLQLEESYREPLVLQVLMGYSTEEIAQHMGLNVGAVLTRLFRARQQLRQILTAGEALSPRSARLEGT